MIDHYRGCTDKQCASTRHSQICCRKQTMWVLMLNLYVLRYWISGHVMLLVMCNIAHFYLVTQWFTQNLLLKGGVMQDAKAVVNSSLLGRITFIINSTQEVSRTQKTGCCWKQQYFRNFIIKAPNGSIKCQRQRWLLIPYNQLFYYFVIFRLILSELDRK